MKKFSKFSEEDKIKTYKVYINLEILVDAENEGDAGYIADNIAESLEEYSSHEIINIKKA